MALISSPAMASSNAVASVLPYEAWLATFQKSLTGPVAFSVALIGIVVGGISLILGSGEVSHFVRTIIYIIMVMSMLIGANSLMTNFFNGASIPMPEQAALTTTYKAQSDRASDLPLKGAAPAAAAAASVAASVAAAVPAAEGAAEPAAVKAVAVAAVATEDNADRAKGSSRSDEADEMIRSMIFVTLPKPVPAHSFISCSDSTLSVFA
ncbi:TrbC/VirB2 family protein [Anaerobiospirillum sp. NML120449]|nr:TrbC/VirB2 family protein [Anaerobiospirillum sp. NML120449]